MATRTRYFLLSIALGGLLGLPPARADIDGFGAGLNWQLNGVASVPYFDPTNANSVILTDAMNKEGSSVFCFDQQNVSSFSVQFTYRYTGATSLDANGNLDPADGVTFVLQNDAKGPAALGADGSGLGYWGIRPSVAVALNLFHMWVRGTNLFTNGVWPYPANAYLDITPVNLLSQDPIQVNLTYDGTTLTEVLSDTVTGDTITLSYTIDIPSAVGDTMAYVGFTGATGGWNSFQTISGFSYAYTGL